MCMYCTFDIAFYHLSQIKIYEMSEEVTDIHYKNLKC